MLWWLPIACAPPPPAPAAPRLTLWSFEGDEAGPACAEDATPLVAPVALRPALASLLTGAPPSRHGVVAPLLHTLSIPSVAARLAEGGVPAWRAPPPSGLDPLHPGEGWGFRPLRDEHAAAGLVWWHGAAHREAVESRWRDGGELLVATRLGDAPRLWACGAAPQAWSGGEPITAEAVGRALLAAAGIEVEGARGEGSPAAAPVTEITPPPSTLRAWRRRGRWPTDPFDPLGSPSPARLAPIRDALARGRLLPARRGVEALERANGPTAVTVAIRAELARRRGLLDLERRQLEALAARWPSAAASLAVARVALEHGDREQVNFSTSQVLSRWSDHAEAQQLRARAALAEGDAPVEAWAWLAVHDPRAAVGLEVEWALRDGAPLPERWEGQLPPGDWGEALRARGRWAVGDAAGAIAVADAVLAARPDAVALRRERAAWALELGDPGEAARLVAPLARLGDPRARALLDEARRQQAAERARIEALRARFRHTAEALVEP